MNRLLKKRMLIISISLALLLLINIGVSYSYYLGKVVGNESDTTLSLKSAGIIVQYENNSGDIEASDIMPGWSTTKNFSVSSNISQNDFTNDQTKLWYEIFLYVDQNDFPSNIMTYTLTPNETIVGNGQVAEARTSVGIETGTNEGGISLGLGYFTVGSNKHDYSVTFNYTDNGSEYSNYPDSYFLVHIGVKVVVSSSIVIDLDGGTIEGATTKYVSKGGTIILPVPTKIDCLFDGWIITSGEGVIDGNSVTVNDEVLNISAIWKDKERYTALVVEMNGGESSQDTINNVKTGEIFTLEAPTRDGYVFRGWKLISGEAEISGNKIVSFNEIVKIEAIWEYVVPEFTYTGKYTLINDSVNDWRIKFLSSGTLTFTTYGNADSGIDVFLVGGGGSGAYIGGGGGGGYTKTKKGYSALVNTEYKITIGGSDTASKAFGYTAKAGGSGEYGEDSQSGGNGGSGGGGQARSWYGATIGAGGSDGGDGGNGQSIGTDGVLYHTYGGGYGQGTTTREFGESSGTLYAGGGGGGCDTGWEQKRSASGGRGGGGSTGNDGTANTGGGGGGGCRNDDSGTTPGGDGGSGIVIIRNARG